MKISRDQVNTIIKNKPAGVTGQQVLDGLIERGYEPEGIDVTAAKAQIAASKPTQQPTELKWNEMTREQQRVKEQKDKDETFGDFKGIGEDIIADTQKRADNISEIQSAMERGDQGKLRSILQTTGQLAGGGADAIGAVFKGAANLLISDKNEKAITSLLKKGVENAMTDPGVKTVVGAVTDWYQGLDPISKRDVDAAGGAISLLTNFIGGEVAARGASATKNAAVAGADAVVDVAKTTANAVKNTAKNSVDNITSTATKIIKSDTASAISQTAKDIASRVPRAATRVQEAAAEKTARAARIKSATPAVQDAIKSNLDDRIINTVTEADAPTIQAYKDVLNIAEETPKKIGMKKQPTIVGGELAAKQYDLISKQKQSVGKQIGEATKALSKDTSIDVQPLISEMDGVLNQNGIKIIENEGKKVFDFSGTKYTPAERTKIQQLYELATEAGDTVSPSQIHSKDQLFSKLQREAQFENVGDLIVDTPEGPSSLFRVFRSIYSKSLDDVSPEIKALNSQYRQLSNLTDDIENSIFKTPDFNVVKSADPAEFAKVNLRRIFGESQSSPVYEGVADAMDAAARGLGYEGASPKAVAEFAQEVRKLFPDTIPATGFTGSVKMGVGDVIEAVSKVGAPNIKDQQQALRKLLDSLLAK